MSFVHDVLGIALVRPGLICDKHQGTIDIYLEDAVNVEITRWHRHGWPGTYRAELFVDVPAKISKPFGFTWTDMGPLTTVVDDFGTLQLLDTDHKRSLRHSLDYEYPR